MTGVTSSPEVGAAAAVGHAGQGAQVGSGLVTVRKQRCKELVSVSLSDCGVQKDSN